MFEVKVTDGCKVVTFESDCSLVACVVNARFEAGKVVLALLEGNCAACDEIRGE